MLCMWVWVWVSVCVFLPNVYKLIWKLPCLKIVLMEIFGFYHINMLNMFKASYCHCFKNCFIIIGFVTLFFCLHCSSKTQIWLVCAQILALFRAWQIVNNTHETLDNSFNCLTFINYKWICCRWSLRTMILKLGVTFKLYILPHGI